jgi:hypothetical protein
MHEAGLTDVKVTVGARRQRDPFTVLIASGVKPKPEAALGLTRSTKTTKSTRITKA